MLPKLNERDLEEVPAVVKKGLTFLFAEHMEEVLQWALLPTPVSGDVVAIASQAGAALAS